MEGHSLPLLPCFENACASLAEGKGVYCKKLEFDPWKL